MGENIKQHRNGKLSIIFSGLALIVLSIELPIGMKHLEGVEVIFFVCGFLVSVVFAILGIVLGRKGAMEFNESLARKGYYMGVAFFVILESALILSLIILH